MKEVKNEHLKTLLSVLFFGGLWGIIEATLGSLLHLPIFDATGIFFCSSTIIVPIAMFMLGCCYKYTGKVRSLIYMGILAASIKAIVCAIFGLKFNPVYYIMLESLVMTGAVILVRPTKLVSLKGLLTFAFANTVYSLGFITIKSKFNITGDLALKYLVETNLLAIAYVAVVGLIAYAIIKLSKNKEEKLPLKKLVYSPIIASLLVATSIALTVVLH